MKPMNKWKTKLLDDTKSVDTHTHQQRPIDNTNDNNCDDKNKQANKQHKPNENQKKNEPSEWSRLEFKQN